MRSTTGQYFPALDHVRAAAMFLVFVWHFTHVDIGYPVPAGERTFLPFLLEGHSGVALFMTLSGYLFAKLLDGKNVAYIPFLWNRFLRLAPLLIIVFAIRGVEHYEAGTSGSYIKILIGGVVLPQWPNGGWSLTTEGHFYLLLPLLLFILRRRPMALLGVVAAMIAIRAGIYLITGELRFVAYMSIVGRLDQFLFGLLAWQYRDLLTGKVAAAAVAAFVAYSFAFSWSGGFHELEKTSVWVINSTIEGAAFACIIGWYDKTKLPDSRLNWIVTKAGQYSYSIYLLHFFVVYKASEFIHLHVMALSNFYVALLWATIGFGLMIPVGHLSFRFIEAPFLRFRVRYTKPAAQPA